MPLDSFRIFGSGGGGGGFAKGHGRITVLYVCGSGLSPTRDLVSGHQPLWGSFPGSLPVPHPERVPDCSSSPVHRFLRLQLRSFSFCHPYGHDGQDEVRVVSVHRGSGTRSRVHVGRGAPWSFVDGPGARVPCRPRCRGGSPYTTVAQDVSP